jgi:hypothetical protein
VTVSAGVRIERPVVMSARLLDIGKRGVLIASSQPLEVGQVAQLSARLGSRAVEASIEVRRVSRAREGTEGYCIGARFVGLDAAALEVLEQFLADGHR